MSELAGRTILVVEDEPLIALLLEAMLHELGCQVLGPARNLEEGIALAHDGKFDCAMLDINLKGKRSDAIVEILGQRRIPYLIATGYGGDWPELRDAIVLEKPYQLPDVERALGRVLIAGNPG